jgi:hypothetical protein
MEKKVWLFFIIHMIMVSYLSAQNFNDKTGKLKTADLPATIDGTPLLKKQDKISADFYKKNPDFLKTNKLNKTTGWNFNVGSQKVWYTFDYTIGQEYPTAATCRGVGKHCYVFVQDSIWDKYLYQSLVDSVINTFDNKNWTKSNKGVYQTNTETFGEPPDIDNDQKIVIMLLDIKDDGQSSGVSVGGFFSSNNELPKTTYAQSNEAEILFIDVVPYDNFLMKNYLGTIAHEFQHLIAWNYDKENKQWTFIKEGCSLAAQVINGFPPFTEYFFVGEPNHYLFDWGTSNVLNNYSRSARFHDYLYDQFGADLFKQIVQGGKVGLETYTTALTNIGSTLKLEDVAANWFIANFILDRAVDPKYDYFSPVYINTRLTRKILPEGTVSKTLQPYGSEAISLESGKNVHVEFVSSSADLKIKGILYGKGFNKVVDINSTSTFFDSEIGVKYNRCIFVAYNLSLDKTASFTAQISGEPTGAVLSWGCPRPLSWIWGNPGDVRGVTFDAFPGGTIDSIRIAVRRPGKLTGKIYKLPGPYAKEYFGKTPTPISKLFTAYSTKRQDPVDFNYPHQNWLKIDLRAEKISTNDPFAVGIDIPLDTSTCPILMLSQNYSYEDFWEFWYSRNINRWDYFIFPGYYDCAPMINTYVSIIIDSTKIIGKVPLVYSLSQNYPNPFNPETKITFSIPIKGFTTLNIYDIMGREIKTLVNEIKDVGEYEIKFSAKDFSSGLYFYRIQCNNFVNTKKMVLLR